MTLPYVSPWPILKSPGRPIVRLLTFLALSELRTKIARFANLGDNLLEHLGVHCQLAPWRRNDDGPSLKLAKILYNKSLIFAAR